MKGKVEKIDMQTKKAVIGGKEVQLGKKLFNPKLPFEVGDMIEYNLKGANFEFVRISFETQPKAGPAGKNPAGSGGKGKTAELFSYPYNFVSLGAKIRRAPFERGKNTGFLECTLINRTPLLITGEKKLDSAGHPSEFFYKEDSRHIIPASGLKGTVKNVFDTVTSSCMKTAEDERLEKRLGAGSFNDRKFGIVKYLPTDDKPGIIVEADMVKVLKDALPREYQKECISEKLRFSKEIYKYANPKVVMPVRKYDKSIESSNVFNSLFNKGDVLGIIWTSSPIFNKKYEKILVTRTDSKEYELTKEAYEDFKYLLEQRDEREKDKGGKLFYYKELREGDPLIFRSEGKKSIDLTFSEVPRLRYECSPEELIPEKFRNCASIEELCPSCRLFGTVDSATGLAGRVAFTDATLRDEKKASFIRNITIKSLGEPHPSLARFYLTNSGGYDKCAGTIRGRKYYWHHRDKIDKDFSAYRKSLEAGSKEKHNSTVELMDKGNQFTFRVNFQNLTDTELGALIYSLQLEDSMLHKIGKAKAFGLGSCQIAIESFKLTSNKTSANNFTKIFEEPKAEKYLEDFRKTVSWTDKNIKEFKKIMSSENSLDFKDSPFPEAEKTDKKGITTKNTLIWFGKNKDAELPYILEYK